MGFKKVIDRSWAALRDEAELPGLRHRIMRLRNDVTIEEENLLYLDIDFGL
jgi:hypothetical protein